MVIDSAQVLPGLTITVSASYATGSSMNSTPAASQAARSGSRTGRDASTMSISPRQNRVKPSTVPAEESVTSVPRCVFSKSATMAWVNGARVLDPSTSTGAVGALADEPQAQVARGISAMSASRKGVIAAAYAAPVTLGLRAAKRGVTHLKRPDGRA